MLFLFIPLGSVKIKLHNHTRREALVKIKRPASTKASVPAKTTISLKIKGNVISVSAKHKEKRQLLCNDVAVLEYNAEVDSTLFVEIKMPTDGHR